MRKLGLMIVVLCLGLMMQAQSVVGSWITVDDKTGEERSIVTIYKGKDGLYYGRIDHIFEEKYRDAVCVPCKGADHNKPVVGMVIIRGMKMDDGELVSGKLLDPESGDFYYGKITYDKKKGMLKLRGSVDRFGLLGRSQYWKRK